MYCVTRSVRNDIQFSLRLFFHLDLRISCVTNKLYIRCKPVFFGDFFAVNDMGQVIYIFDLNNGDILTKTMYSNSFCYMYNLFLCCLTETIYRLSLFYSELTWHAHTFVCPLFFRKARYLSFFFSKAIVFDDKTFMRPIIVFYWEQYYITWWNNIID